MNDNRFEIFCKLYDFSMQLQDWLNENACELVAKNSIYEDSENLTDREYDKLENSINTLIDEVGCIYEKFIEYSKKVIERYNLENKTDEIIVGFIDDICKGRPEFSRALQILNDYL